MNKEYLKTDKIEGSLIECSKVHRVGFGEVVQVRVEGEKPLIGRVVKIDQDRVTVQVFGETLGQSVNNTGLIFEGRPFEIPLSKAILGRRFNGIGLPIDGGGEIYANKTYNVNGRPMNPVSREYPRDFIETGISSIDSLTTLIRGQKLPIFSGSGLPHNKLAAQIVKQARIQNAGADYNFSVVFAAIGVKHDEERFFTDAFKKAGVMDNVVMFVNYADDPIMERLIAPKCALTAAEYLAFEENQHVLVIMTDITSYAEALREVSSLREEVPGRKGYPGYLYSDFAMLYERAGMLHDREGSVTLIPILTMPNDDITHPIPDLTGYITEGQIVLSRELNAKDIYPPINVLPSLSRLMKDGIGVGYTREDHPEVANQLFSAYSKVQDIRALAQIIGEEDLSEADRMFLRFGENFEDRFLSQDFSENRTMTQSLDLGWELIKMLPSDAVHNITPALRDKYLTGKED